VDPPDEVNDSIEDILQEEDTGDVPEFPEPDDNEDD